MEDNVLMMRCTQCGEMNRLPVVHCKKCGARLDFETAEQRMKDASGPSVEQQIRMAAKLVLASTKDHAHRIYLRDGMFAEITLFYRHGRWEDHEFTFPDYRRADYHAFFSECRRRLKNRST